MGSLRDQRNDLSLILRDYEERLQALETGQRAGYTTIGSGALGATNGSGVQVVNIGSNPNTGGYGIEVSSDGTGSPSSFVKVGGTTNYGPVLVPLASGWYNWKDQNPSSTDIRLQVWMSGITVHIGGLVGNSNAFSSGSTVAASGAIPASLRPAGNVLGWVNNGGLRIDRVDVHQDGSIGYIPSVSHGAGEYHSFNFSWTVNNNI